MRRGCGDSAKLCDLERLARPLNPLTNILTGFALIAALYNLQLDFVRFTRNVSTLKDELSAILLKWAVTPQIMMSIIEILAKMIPNLKNSPMGMNRRHLRHQVSYLILV